MDYYEKCIICSHERLKEKYVVNNFNIVRCENCTLTFVKNRIKQGELDKFYTNSGYVYEDAGNVNNLNYYYSKLKKLIETRISKGAILDVGCSSGQFLAQMNNWECHGIEISANMAEKARKFSGNIFNGTLENYPVVNNKFDVITLQDVLDHMIDPLKALKIVYSLLKPGGIIIIKVHNINCLYAKISGKNFYAITPPAHLSYFNKKSLKNLVEITGFKYLGSKYIAHKLFLKTVFLRLSKGKENKMRQVYNFLDNSKLGHFTIKKNLRDIITLMAQKAI